MLAVVIFIHDIRKAAPFRVNTGAFRRRLEASNIRVSQCAFYMHVYKKACSSQRSLELCSALNGYQFSLIVFDS
jgi:hypothetical protein